MSKQLDDKLNNLQPEQLELWKLRHTCEHVLHQAIKETFPQVNLAMGPATEEGFYCDVDTSPVGKDPVKLSESDFKTIEKRMHSLINKNLPMIRQEITVAEARKLFPDNPYKQEWIDLIEQRGEKVTIYWTGEPGGKDSMVDLCGGPHAPSTGAVKAFKLLSVAGAYWHGDEKNKMLTRIYGTAYGSKQQLEEHLHRIEEAKRRDHRKLGQKYDLFTFSDLIGSGLPLYTQKGALIRRLLNEFVEQLQTQADYMQVWTPQIAKASLFKTSGHYDKYKDDMFKVISSYSDEEMYLKPMNCPQHTQIFQSQPRSYRDLPIRMTDFAMLYRDERPGELNGLARVRSFSQDDCHIFCTEEQVDEEIDKALEMTKTVMDAFGFKYRYRLSTRDPKDPKKYLGDPATWDKVEEWAVRIMKRNHIDYFDGPGEAAFYAPKMDLMATDALGREWQLSTVQIDYVMPERFDLKYTDKDGIEKRPVMLHRAILGSAERMMMILIEHYAGAFPVWLAPVQAVVIPISQDQLTYAHKVAQELKGGGVRVEVSTNASMQKAIRTGEQQKVPYMLVVGQKEEASGSVAVRQRGQKDLGVMNLANFTNQILDDIGQKRVW